MVAQCGCSAQLLGAGGVVVVEAVGWGVVVRQGGAEAHVTRNLPANFIAGTIAEMARLNNDWILGDTGVSHVS